MIVEAAASSMARSLMVPLVTSPLTIIGTL